MKKMTLVLGLLVVAVLLLAAPAFGQAREPYSNSKPNNRPRPPVNVTPPEWETPELNPAPGLPPDVVEGTIQGRPPVLEEVVQPGVIPEVETPGQILPFTGADLLLYGLTGAAALGTGAALLKFTGRSKGDSSEDA